VPALDPVTAASGCQATGYAVTGAALKIGRCKNLRLRDCMMTYSVAELPAKKN